MAWQWQWHSTYRMERYPWSRSRGSVAKSLTVRQWDRKQRDRQEGRMSGALEDAKPVGAGNSPGNGASIRGNSGIEYWKKIIINIKTRYKNY